MIKTYYIEDLTLDDVDALVERGVCFNVTSKAALLSERDSAGNRDAFWYPGDKSTDNLG